MMILGVIKISVFHYMRIQISPYNSKFVLGTFVSAFLICFQYPRSCSTQIVYIRLILSFTLVLYQSESESESDSLVFVHLVGLVL